MRSAYLAVLALISMSALTAPGAALAQSSGACAESQKAALDPARANSEEAVQLTSAERLHIRVQGFPDLSSEYRVNADNTVSIPVIGRVSVADRTAACLEEALSTMASKIAKRDVYVTVEISAYRPIFVTGAVARPGNIPWFPGMTVLQAATMAGGMYRAATLGGSGSVVDTGRIKKLSDAKKRTLAKWARLQAELDDAGALSPPPELLKLAGAEDASALIKDQEALFTSRQAALRNEMATIDRGIAVAKEELSSLKQSQDRVSEQLHMRRVNRQKIQELLAKGFVRAERGMEEEARVSELEQKALDISVSRSRVSAALAGLERDSGALRVGRRATIESEIFDVERELAEISTDLQALQLNTGGSVARSENSEEISYAIIRRTNSEPTRITARETDVLKAGDVLVVSLGPL